MRHKRRRSPARVACEWQLTTRLGEGAAAKVDGGADREASPPVSQYGADTSERVDLLVIFYETVVYVHRPPR